MRSLALKGRRFETWAEIEQAVERATAHRLPDASGSRRRRKDLQRACQFAWTATLPGRSAGFRAVLAGAHHRHGWGAGATICPELFQVHGLRPAGRPIL